jgi:hypothetical protein
MIKQAEQHLPLPGCHRHRNPIVHDHISPLGLVKIPDPAQVDEMGFVDSEESFVIQQILKFFDGPGNKDLPSVHNIKG